MYPSRSGAREARVTELEAVVTTGGHRMRRWSILIVIAFAFSPSTATAQFCFRGAADSVGRSSGHHCRRSRCCFWRRVRCVGNFDV